MSFTGQLWDLSLGGLSVALDIFGVQPKVEAPVWVSFTTPDGALDFYCNVLHRRMHEGMNIYGVRFLPLVDRIANAQREQKLWRFLVAVQRNAKQERTPAPAPRTFHDWKLHPQVGRATLHEGIPPRMDQ
jgi:hypothetical protein